MGYRSEVVLAVDKRIEGMLIHVFTSCPGAYELCHGAGAVFKKIDRKDALMFHWKDIKWYESFEEIGAIERFMNKLDNSDDIEIDGVWISLSDLYRFVRTGEEFDDIEVRGFGFDMIYPYTSINADLG